MSDTPLSFVVEQAGCESCAARIRSALAPLLRLEDVVIDEAADTAKVTATSQDAISLEAVNAALASASAGSGHTYRVAPDSWRGVGERRGRAEP